MTLAEFFAGLVPCIIPFFLFASWLSNISDDSSGKSNGDKKEEKGDDKKDDANLS